ncbi:MAG: TfoX/Sxy family DNA transformation protein [Gammaproteobacteria bacterium]
MKKSGLGELKNIGKAVEKRLNEIGIHSRYDLEMIGAAKAYQKLSVRHPGRHLPVCYYLYSLQGALQDKHWDDYSEQEKKALRLAAGLTE